MNTTAKGSSAENRVVRHLQGQGWLVGSLRHYACAGDHIAIHPKFRTRVIETKGCKEGTLWSNFRKGDRAELLALAKDFDADPLLAHSPSDKKPIVFLTRDQWPS